MKLPYCQQISIYKLRDFKGVALYPEPHPACQIQAGVMFACSLIVKAQGK